MIVICPKTRNAMLKIEDAQGIDIGEEISARRKALMTLIKGYDSKELNGDTLYYAMKLLEDLDISPSQMTRALI